MIVNGREMSGTKRRRLAKVKRRNVDVAHVFAKGVPFTDSQGRQYISLDCSQPVFKIGERDADGNKILDYVINKCRIVAA